MAPSTGLQEVVRGEPLAIVKRALANAGHRVLGLNPEQQSLLFFAVQREEDAVKVCRLLIHDYRIDADLEDFRGQTAFHWLATTQNLDCVDLLVAAKCNVNHVDRLLNQTPLFYAAHRSGVHMVRRLLVAQADTSYRDLHGKSPLCWALHVDTCKELAACCASRFAIGEGKKLIADTLEWHRQHRRAAVVKYLAASSEAWNFPRRMSWAVKDEVPKDPSGVFSAYVTSLALQRDVQALCALEDEFIGDHRILLPNLLDEQFFDQIGLNPDPVARSSTIRSIALRTPCGGCSRGSGAPPQRGPVRHYTLVCTHLPDNRKGTSGSARARSFQVAGYVYFKVVDGSRDDDAEDEDSDSSAEPADDLQTQFHIVISHLKVSRIHQRRGVACLLLASALRIAIGAREGLDCRSIWLSVAGGNDAALGLYRKLGFAVSMRPCKYEGWVSMRRNVVEPSLDALASKWMAKVWRWGSHAGTTTAPNPADVSGPSPVNLEAKCEVMAMTTSECEADSDDPGMPLLKRRRKLSSSESCGSDVSTSAGSCVSSVSASLSSASSLAAFLRASGV